MTELSLKYLEAGPVHLALQLHITAVRSKLQFVLHSSSAGILGTSASLSPYL